MLLNSGREPCEFASSQHLREAQMRRGSCGRHRHAALLTPLAAANHAPQASASQPTRHTRPPARADTVRISFAAIWMTPRQVTIDDRSTLPQGCPAAGADRWWTGGEGG